MKIVTYNVNGLRPRVAQHGSLLNLLNSLDADIICFQETKLSRQDLSVDLTMAEGYEAFFSCARSSNKGRSGYSGVATFCRVNSAFSSNEVTLPVAAKEGFTGLLYCSDKNEVVTSDCPYQIPMQDEGLEDITKKDLVKMDGEGRCIITDHGHFVLFNLYGPVAEEDNAERMRFKFAFYKILEKRWEYLLNQGRRVFVVGDLNIAPSAIDRCDAEPAFESKPFRKWLRSILRESGGPFFDAFRSKHPERRDAYTCFSQSVGAEEFNYGSRIDHILIAGPCFHQNHYSEGHNFVDCHLGDCDIMSQFRRGTEANAPKWKGGRTIKLEGSDHVPVFSVTNDMPTVPLHSTPPLAVRYIPEVRGQQQKIVTFLKRSQESSFANHSDESEYNCTTTGRKSCKFLEPCEDSRKSFGMPFGLSHLSPYQKCPASHQSEIAVQRLRPSDSELTPFVVKDTEKIEVALEAEETESHCSNTTLKKKARQTGCYQLTLRSFFQRSNSKVLEMTDIGTSKTDRSLTPLVSGNEEHALLHEMKQLDDSDAAKEAESMDFEVNESNISTQIQGSLKVNTNSATLEWQRIQEKMKMSIPLCRGHREPCVARTVKKGPNMGRRFYVCSRAKGPASNPEANCNHFQWASVMSKRKHR